MRVPPYRYNLCALLAFCACVSATGLARAAEAEHFPTKPIRLIIPFPPGGSNDILGRFLTHRLSERLGKQVVADNRAGADGIIGTGLAARSPADGHTLLMVSTTYTMNPAIHKLPYDPVKSLMPIAQIASGASVIAVHPSFPARTVKELVALSKARPDEIRYASSGVGGFNHFCGELFNMLAGVKLVHIPYKGGAPAMLDVMTGQVEVVFSTLIQALPHIGSGKLKPLGVGAPGRSPVLPQVPTVGESLPGYDGNIWWGVLAPAGVAEPIVARLNGEINAILREAETQRRLLAQAAEPTVAKPEAFGKLIESDIAKWARIAKKAGIRANN